MTLLALGTNLGDRMAHLQGAVKAIQSTGSIRLVAAAPVYETDPVDCPPGSQSFYNTVIQVFTILEPLELLRTLRSLEASLGRPNEHAHHAPRTIDIDILIHNVATIDSEELRLPHPRMLQRRFVLQPLSDICPDLIPPGSSLTITQHLQTLSSSEPPLKKVVDIWLIDRHFS